MHLTLGLAATLAVAADALPKGPGSSLLFSRESENENATIPNEPVNDGAIDTCESIKSKNPESWEDNEIGDWFVIMASKQEEYTEDIQKTVQSWAKGGDIYGFHCDPMEDCSPSGFPVKECKEDAINAAVYFILWSTSYFNKWVTSLARAVDTTSGIATAKAAKIADTFSSDPDEVPMNTAGPILAAALLGTIGSLVPGAFAAVAGVGGGIASIITGAMVQVNYDQEIELEPQFNNFEDISDYIGGATETMLKGIEAFANHVLVDTPEDTDDYYYADDPAGLPQLLKDGTFAESVSVSMLDERIYTSLFSGAITTSWASENAIIVKVHKDEPTLITPPCETDGFFYGRIWCDDEGTAHLLLKFPEPNTWYKDPMSRDVIDEFGDVPGADDLEDFGLSIEIVARGSELAASLNDGNPYYEWDAESALDHLLENADDVAKFSTFNLPVCELDTVDFEGNFMDYIERLDDDDCGAECQILYRMTNCYYDWGGMAGDYDFTMIYWEDECDFNREKCEAAPCMGGMVGC